MRTQYYSNYTPTILVLSLNFGILFYGFKSNAVSAWGSMLLSTESLKFWASRVLFSIYWGVQPSCQQERKDPLAHGDRRRLILSLRLLTRCTDWAPLLPGQKDMSSQGGFGHTSLKLLQKAAAHRDTWVPCSSSELESLCTGEKILNCSREEGKVYPQDKIRGMSPIYHFTSVLLFSCCYGNTRESGYHCVFKDPCKV